MNKWEKYVNKVAEISEASGRCLGILKNVIVNDEEKLVMAQTKLSHSLGLELFFQIYPFNIDKHFDGYDIVITSNSNIENGKDRENYVAYAYAIYSYMIANFKRKGNIEESDANIFATIGNDLGEVGISAKETYNIAKNICDTIGFPLENITRVGIATLRNRGPNIGNMIKAFVVSLEDRNE